MIIENLTIKSVADIEQLQGANLTRFVNQLTGGTVKKFSDRATALNKAVEAFKAAGEKPVDFENYVTAKDTTTATTKPSRRGSSTKAARRAKAAKKPAGERKQRDRKVFDLKPRSSIKEHREGTARAKAVDCLKKGATFAQVQARTGWKKHRHCYEGIRLLNTHLGWGIKEDDKGVIKIFTK